MNILRKKNSFLGEITSKRPLWTPFIDGVQLSQGYRATTKRQFNFYR